MDHLRISQNQKRAQTYSPPSHARNPSLFESKEVLIIVINNAFEQRHQFKSPQVSTSYKGDHILSLLAFSIFILSSIFFANTSQKHHKNSHNQNIQQTLSPEEKRRATALCRPRNEYLAATMCGCDNQTSVSRNDAGAVAIIHATSEASAKARQLRLFFSNPTNSPTDFTKVTIDSEEVRDIWSHSNPSSLSLEIQ